MVFYNEGGGSSATVDTIARTQIASIVAAGDINTTQVAVAGNAPATNSIPASISGQSRDEGDYEVQVYDDYRVVYEFASGGPIEKTRELLTTSAYETIDLTAVANLVADPNKMNVYRLLATTPLTNVDGEDRVIYPAPTIAELGLQFKVIGLVSEHMRVTGTINGQSDIDINANDRELTFISVPGGWETSW